MFPSPALEPHHWLAWALPVGPSLRAALRWGSAHSGLPVVLVAALAIVVSLRLVKRAARLAVEVVVATVLLLMATRLGWITW